MSKKITPVYETSIPNLLYEFKQENPEGYKGIVAFFEKNAPLLDPSVGEQILQKSQLKDLIKMQMAVAHVECGLSELGARIRHGEKNLLVENEAATERLANRFGGYEKYFELQNYVSDGKLKEFIEHAEQKQAEKESLSHAPAPHAPLEPVGEKPSWQEFVSNRNQATTEIVRS
jgi:hypothetical protein